MKPLALLSGLFFGGCAATQISSIQTVQTIPSTKTTVNSNISELKIDQNSLFSNRASTSTATPHQEAVTFIAVGDIRLDGPVGDIIQGRDFEAPTAKIRQEIRGDIIFGNLECPVTNRGEKVSKKWNFRAPAENLPALKVAGFTLLNLANNHVLDYGPQGLEDTIKALDHAHLPHIGAGMNRDEAVKPYFITVHGIKIGILGYTSTFPETAWAGKKHPGVAYSNFDRYPAHIKEIKSRCDVLIVSFHGGTELAKEPNEVQKEFGRVAIDAGADLVIGHHPHVIQPIEIYKGKFIIHSIGNFLFVSPTPTTKYSVIVKASLTKEGVSKIEFVPIDTNYGRPVLAPPEGAKLMHDWLNRYGTVDQSSGTVYVRIVDF